MLKHYTLVDVQARWALTEYLDLYGRVENLTDAMYQTTLNYGSVGRGFYAGVRAHF